MSEISLFKAPTNLSADFFRSIFSSFNFLSGLVDVRRLGFARPDLGLGVGRALTPSTLALLASFDSLLYFCYILMAAMVALSAAA